MAQRREPPASSMSIWLKPRHNTRHALIVQALGCILARVVVGVSKRCGVRDHDRRVTALPE
jgi:hypothetical protein